MQFDINLSILFAEVPLLERFERAAAAGFTAVELWWPRGEDLTAVAAAASAAGVRVVGLNFDAGDMPAGDRGLLSDPAREHLFRENVPVALALAAELGCTKLNALVGTRVEGLTRGEQLALARANVRFAADRAAEQGASVLIEAVNTIENGPYLLVGTDEALAFVDEVDRPNVELLFDVYHMQRMGEDLAVTIRAHAGRFGHVQIADSPDRHEPGTGEIDFRSVLGLLRDAGYEGSVGLEYKARGATEDSLAWLPREARAGDVDPDQIFMALQEVRG
jgi:hydroxypyruvate isomerase